jgi:TRAP-type C4-dicarboxylate transport system substrate-binding protein
MHPLSLRFGGYQPPTSVHTKAAEVFGTALRTQLGEAVRFDLEGNITAAGHQAVDLLRMVEHGALTMCYFSASYLADRVPEFALLDLPFTITDRDHAYAILDGPLGQLLADKLSAHTGLRLLGFWDNGFRHFSNALRPIRTPADCVGMRLRTLFSAMHRQVFELLGFTPVALDVKDLIAAVRAGSIDAQENPLTNIYNFGFHMQHRYITLSGHFFGTAVLLCHQASYNSWPVEVRQAVGDAACAATAAQRHFAAAEDDAVLARLHPSQNEVVRPTPAERALFVEAVAPILVSQRQIFGDHLFHYVA